MAISFPTNPGFNQTFTVGDIVWTWNGSSWEGATSANLQYLESNITILQGNVANLTANISGNIYADSNVIALLGNYSANITPSTNATYSLGNVSNQWSELWVSNNTIYIGGVPLGINAENVLTINGSPVLTDDSATDISTSGNLVAANLVSSGSISADSFFFSNGDPFTSGVTYINNKTGNVLLTTANIAESGNTNLYFSNVRAIEAVPSAITKLPVTNPGAYFEMGRQYDGRNPNIYVTAGQTIAFDLDIHPERFMITDAVQGNYVNEGLTHFAANGVITTNLQAQLKSTGTLFWKVPHDFRNDTYFYSSFDNPATIYGRIFIGDPSASTFGANLQVVEGNITTIESNIATIESNIATLEGNVDTIEGNIADLENSVANIGVYTNSNVAAYLPTYTGTIKAGSINTLAGNITFQNGIIVSNSDDNLSFINEGSSREIIIRPKATALSDNFFSFGSNGTYRLNINDNDGFPVSNGTVSLVVYPNNSIQTTAAIVTTKDMSVGSINLLANGQIQADSLLLDGTEITSGGGGGGGGVNNLAYFDMTGQSITTTNESIRFDPGPLYETSTGDITRNYLTSTIMGFQITTLGWYVVDVTITLNGVPGGNQGPIRIELVRGSTTVLHAFNAEIPSLYDSADTNGDYRSFSFICGPFQHTNAADEFWLKIRTYGPTGLSIYDGTRGSSRFIVRQI